MPLDLLHLTIEVAGTLAFFIAGLLTAARKRLDAVGSFSVACLSAFGGGTMRDLLLDRRPFFWVHNADWLWGLLLLTLLAMRYLDRRHVATTQRAIQWPDALGLGLFAASGTQIALAAGMPALIAVLMGTMTAACGGVLRDIACAEVPAAFNDHQPYAVCAFAGGWLVVLGEHLGWPPGPGLFAGAALACGLRGWTLWRGIRLPEWRAGRR
ncbi:MULTISPECIES: trimeric intracellular cation channel family protein [Rubrivivax]|uniref:Trimeric intracellular cation channel family protein n=1 Tax=Rubrivivax benzoatilyticus TaxID=316997 RepID=A0ABX0HZV7_9BURK|nr:MULTISPECIES: trimeric intracellular cation channel family protein [Rubrivivax]MCD0422809.1 trimeric intracellular cation channel family protein [Rubrivivax sp. JA1024]EGJ12030.1 putative transmembrane protein [Rubrivivax benzoatilyticus JA2 = ATCC BAA-35]MCC9596903.1 trimeric intracellular cation channel family protein [Rubrivivax sp. JA1055]MCC9649059.1 trimeric intracellular cation channel family protein [Rubrivivax sp. JA1029]NHK98889.1 trimeric intracellular cation channel family prote